jgi:hypothetical protein
VLAKAAWPMLATPGGWPGNPIKTSHPSVALVTSFPSQSPIQSPLLVGSVRTDPTFPLFPAGWDSSFIYSVRRDFFVAVSLFGLKVSQAISSPNGSGNVNEVHGWPLRVRACSNYPSGAIAPSSPASTDKHPRTNMHRSVSVSTA